MAVIKFPGKGLTIDSGQVLTLTGVTVTGLTAASVGAGTFPAGAYVFNGAVSGVTTLETSNATAISLGAIGGRQRIQYDGTGAGTHSFLNAANSSANINALGATFSGTAYIGDTNNANVTLGLTINQGAADDEILSLKSSDVAHGITTLAETDTYGFAKKQSATTGGLQIVGVGEDLEAVRLSGVAGVVDATKSTGAVGVIDLLCAIKSGTGVASVGANKNMVVVRDNGTTRFILDSDGDSHQDVGTAWTNYDTHDDVALLNLLAAHVTRKNDPLRKSFAAFLKQNRKELERIKLVKFNRNGHHFVNMSRLTMLLTGATRQLGAQVSELRAAIRQINPKLLPV